MVACCSTCCVSWLHATDALGYRTQAKARPRARTRGVRQGASHASQSPCLTHHGGLLQYVLRQLAARD